MTVKREVVGVMKDEMWERRSEEQGCKEKSWHSSHMLKFFTRSHCLVFAISEKFDPACQMVDLLTLLYRN